MRSRLFGLGVYVFYSLIHLYVGRSAPLWENIALDAHVLAAQANVSNVMGARLQSLLADTFTEECRAAVTESLAETR